MTDGDDRTPARMLFVEVVSAAWTARRASFEEQRVAALADCIARIPPESRRLGLTLLSGRIPENKLGISASRWPVQGDQPALPALTLAEVGERLAAIRGETSRDLPRKMAGATALMKLTTRGEATFLLALVRGELRSTALDGSLVEAVARLVQLPSVRLWEAVQLCGDLVEAAAAALAGGEARLKRLTGRSSPEALRDPELEAAILERPYDPEPALVYADWLMDQGQPHGELIAESIAAESTKSKSRALDKPFKRFFRQEHPGAGIREHLTSGPTNALWRQGFLRELSLPWEASADTQRAEAWLRLLGGTAALCLERLSMQLGRYLPLDRLPALPALERVALVQATEWELPLESLARHTRLHHLEVDGGSSGRERRLAGIEHLPHLRSLRLGSGFSDLADVVGAPALASLTVTGGGSIDVTPLRGMRSLQKLVLDRWIDTPNLAVLDTLPQLEHLDVRYASSDLREWGRRRNIRVGTIGGFREA